MHIIIRLEVGYLDEIFFSELSIISNEIEDNLSKELIDSYNEDEIKTHFLVVCRVFPRKKYIGTIYKEVVQFSRKNFIAAVATNYNYEDIQNYTNLELYNLFIDLVVNSIERLKVKKLKLEYDKLKKDVLNLKK